MDADEWDSDGEFEATIIEMEAKEADAISSQVESNSKVTAEPIELPKCSTPRSLTPQTTNGLSLSLSTISYVNSPATIDKLDILKKPRLDVSTKKKRKFPGPAGALPKLILFAHGVAMCAMLMQKKDVDIRALKDSCVETQAETEHNEVAVSQSSQPLSISSYPSWNRLVEDLQLSKEHLHRHSIANALDHACKKQLPDGKVPLLVAVVTSINKSLPDATVSLKDLTGTISGVIHRLLVNEHRDTLKVGSALLLKQVAVFSPSRRRQYLNITPNNLLQVFYEQEKTATVDSISVGKLTVPLQTLLTQPVSCTAPKPVTTEGGLSTLASDRTSRLLNTVTTSYYNKNSTPLSTALTARADSASHKPLNARSLNEAEEDNSRPSNPSAVNSSKRLTNASTGVLPGANKPPSTDQHLFEDDDFDDLDLDF